MKTIVSIVSEQTVPNYLFIKEFFQEDDKLIFIATEKTKNRIEWITNVLQYNSEDAIIFTLPHNGEQRTDWNQLLIALPSMITTEFYINLTGGTKYMTLCVYQIFQQYNSRFFYIPLPKNEIIEFNKDVTIPIKHRLTVEEYLQIYGLKVKSTGNTTHTSDLSTQILKAWVTLEEDDFKMIDALRSYRSRKNSSYEYIKKPTSKNCTAIPNIETIMEKLPIQQEKENCLSKKEIQYITGGWLEEYMYYFIRKNLEPTDLKISLTIEHAHSTDSNELDVVFTLGNKLYIVECKTSLWGNSQHAAMREIVYKAAALKDSLGNLGANSYIAALVNDIDGELDSAAKCMRINLLDNSFFYDTETHNNTIKRLIDLAH